MGISCGCKRFGSPDLEEARRGGTPEGAARLSLRMAAGAGTARPGRSRRRPHAASQITSIEPTSRPLRPSIFEIRTACPSARSLMPDRSRAER